MAAGFATLARPRRAGRAVACRSSRSVRQLTGTKDPPQPPLTAAIGVRRQAIWLRSAIRFGPVAETRAHQRTCSGQRLIRPGRGRTGGTNRPNPRRRVLSPKASRTSPGRNSLISPGPYGIPNASSASSGRAASVTMSTAPAFLTGGPRMGHNPRTLPATQPPASVLPEPPGRPPRAGRSCRRGISQSRARPTAASLRFTPGRPWTRASQPRSASVGRTGGGPACEPNPAARRLGFDCG